MGVERMSVEAERMTERRRFDRRGGPSGRVENATTLVRTATLADRGIDQIRVLSESKFLGLVRRMVDESMDQHVDDAYAELAASPAAARANGSHDIEGAYQKKWEELRARHEESLERSRGPEHEGGRRGHRGRGCRDGEAGSDRREGAGGPAGTVDGRHPVVGDGIADDVRRPRGAVCERRPPAARVDDGCDARRRRRGRRPAAGLVHGVDGCGLAPAGRGGLRAPQAVARRRCRSDGRAPGLAAPEGVERAALGEHELGDDNAAIRRRLDPRRGWR